MKTLLYLIPVILLAAFCACGEGEPAPSGPTPAVLLDVLPAGPAVPGKPLTVAWRFTLGDHWHLYWTGRNDSGFPPGIKLDLPRGWTAGELAWPPPERLILPGDILDHVYHDELVLLQDLTAPQGLAPGIRVEIPAKINWLACREMCVPGDTTLTLTLVTAAEKPMTPEPAWITGARQALPLELPDGPMAWGWEGTDLVLDIPDAKRLEFYPAGDCGDLINPIAEASAFGNRLRLGFKDRDGVVGPARGLLHNQTEDGLEFTYRVDLPGPTLSRP